MHFDTEVGGSSFRFKTFKVIQANVGSSRPSEVGHRDQEAGQGHHHELGLGDMKCPPILDGLYYYSPPET